jgi:hypothetical protein
MSIDRNMHLGPYAQCIYVKRTRPVERDGCEDHPGVYLAGKFCPSCGKPVGKYTVDVADRPDIMEITDESLYGAMASDDGCIAMANVRRKGAPKRETDSDAEAADDLRGVDMAAECAWFEKAFKPELTKLRSVCLSVEVRWGLVRWFS